ncbi:ACP S-malonyltransferase [Psychrosphaera sp. B3R10]|uniref:ACP S-malonyltransferase n=1 Tax=unclassified Psychrosphaera TaxID=2641570 RepID=UPI001C08AF81|nr:MULTISPECIES: ACP S-malonyltransferase [unclassified Psychrosphaera]MBU2880956.1 ACP S-malonyltransferase [Psychrosphaera sp. I2R16]MBU2990825.1 ACP S-malonyltransferase [Psychrosphaera sp. B3R10]MDO6720521.1 ACP S-malonyltransferase [Psychrosphaera sp. 1_MG-2023]
MTKAIIFPGQGSQSVGMLADLYDKFDVVQSTFNQASDALGYDLWALVKDDAEGKLSQTEFTQPALLTASVAVWRAYVAEGGSVPRYLAGHSLGEYSALVCAGVLSLEDAVKLVEKRGQYMQQAVPAGTGAMAAIIGLADDLIAKACSEAAQGEVVSPVNFNSPGQIVIAGNKAAVERAMELCKEAGAKRALPLPVSVPSHCALMKPAADMLAADLVNLEFNTPEISVVNNVDVKVESDPEAIKQALIKQLYSPVRWTETIQFFAAEGITDSFEFGPGKVLSGLAKRIDKSVSCVSVSDSDSLLAIVK